METAPSEPRIRVGPQHQVIDNPQQPDIYVRIDRGKRSLSFKECKIEKVEVEGKFVGLHTRGSRVNSSVALICCHHFTRTKPRSQAQHRADLLNLGRGKLDYLIMMTMNLFSFFGVLCYGSQE